MELASPSCVSFKHAVSIWGKLLRFFTAVWGGASDTSLEFMWRWMEEIHRNLHISGFNHRYLGPCLNTGSFRTSSKVVTCCYWTDVERGNVKMNHMLFHGVKQVDLWKWFGHVIQQYVYIVLMSIWKHKSSISSVYVPKTTEKNHTNISWHDVFFPHIFVTGRFENLTWPRPSLTEATFTFAKPKAANCVSSRHTSCQLSFGTFA